MKCLMLFGLAALAACNQPASRQPTAARTPAVVPALVDSASTIHTAQARALLARPGTQVLDVRTPPEYAAGHLVAARNLDVNGEQFGRQVAQLDTAQTYVLYCHSGKRSARAADILQRSGFRHVVNGGAYDSLRQR